MTKAPAWAREIVADLDSEVIDPVIVARLLTCDAAWKAFPSDEVRCEVLTQLIYFDALFGFDPARRIPTPAKTRAHLRAAAAHLRAAADEMAQVPDGTLGGVGMAARALPHMLRLQADVLEANAGTPRVRRATARHDDLVDYLSALVQFHTRRRLHKVTAALASAFLGETVTVDTITKRPSFKSFFLLKARANR